MANLLSIIAKLGRFGNRYDKVILTPEGQDRLNGLHRATARYYKGRKLMYSEAWDCR